MNSITILIQGVPVPQGRPKCTTIGGNARMYDPPKSKKEKQRIAAIATAMMKEHGWEMIEGPITCRITFMMPLPKSAERKRNPAKAQWHISTPDADNLAKTVLDALNEVAYHDDSQICNIHIMKVRCQQDDSPRTIIQLMKAKEDIDV